MKEYYYLKEEKEYGPFTIEQLSNEGLTMQTYIWTEGMQDWKKLKDLPYLAKKIILKPPPPPGDPTEKPIEPPKKLIEPKKKMLKRLIIWSGFHSFALLMSHTGIPIFNDFTPEKSSFWPFVKFFEINKNLYTGKKYVNFYGIFVEYDWTEFTFYVGVALIIYLIIKISK